MTRKGLSKVEYSLIRPLKMSDAIRGLYSFVSQIKILILLTVNHTIPNFDARDTSC